MNNIIINAVKNDKVIKQILPFLQGVETYVVGGYVRDALGGKTSPDRDIIPLCADIKGFVRDIANKINATFIELDNEHGIYRLVLENKHDYIDFALALENDIEKDLKRRDITINSIAVSLADFSILDPNNGIKDYEQKIIRAISEDNLVDDPLRLLRIFRFQSMLASSGFTIEPQTIEWIKRHASLINLPAKERVNTEIIKLFEGDFAAKTLLLADATGLLVHIFPFVSEVKKIPPNTHHHLGLFEHSVETVSHVERLYSTLSLQAQEVLSTCPYNTVKKLAFLKLAAFMHDIGKPQTWSIDEVTGRHRFIMHDDVGSKIVKPELKELKFSKKQIEYISLMIKNHIYPSNVNIDNEKSVMKFFRKLGDNVVDIILLAMSDRLSARGPAITEEMVSQNISTLQYLLAQYFIMLERLKPLPKLLSGNEIMELLEISPSPMLGRIIAELKEAQENGDVETKEQAEAFVRQIAGNISN